MAKKGSEWAARIKGEVQKSIIGQDVVIERLLVALLSNGHVLLEGLPGLAKTLLIKSLGAAMGLDFERMPVWIFKNSIWNTSGRTREFFRQEKIKRQAFTC